MTALYTFPNNATMREINQDYMPRLRAGRVFLDLFPENEVPYDNVIWEQRDDFTGLMQARGLNGDPPKVDPKGWKTWVKVPGVYGEYIPINEAEITARRAPGTFGTPLDVTDMVTQRNNQLMVRQYDRCEWVLAQLLCLGTYTVVGPNGSVQDQDTFPIPNYVAGVPWSTFATAAPLADLRAVALFGRGHSVDFSRGMVVMNQRTFNNLASNNNSADLYGRRAMGLSTINNLQGFNELLTGDNLPSIVIYDAGYKDDAGAFTVYVPDGTAVVIGRRMDGSPIGEWMYTKNANTEPAGSPGVYSKVIDKGEIQVPRILECHRGFNGGPALYYPSAVVRMTGL